MNPLNHKVNWLLVVAGASLIFAGFKLSGSGVGTTFWSPVFAGIGTSVVAVAVANWVSAMHRAIPGEQERQFLALFGKNALSRNERGKILIQADDVEKLLTGFKGATENAKSEMIDALNNHSANNRLYKARTWVNARDAEAACLIRDGFRKDKFATPDLQIIEHGRDYERLESDPFERHASAPYIISLGLAWTDTTMALTNDEQVTGKSFYIDPSSKHGDAITVRGDHLRDYTQLNKEAVLNEDLKPEYRSEALPYYRIFPKPWDHSAWASKSGNEVNDYAIIVRHTHRVARNSQVRIILAGFTEDGTVAAARYLVNRQSDLYALHLKFKEEKSNQSGDFVAIITGPANTNSLWNAPPVIAFSKVTNSSLEEGSFSRSIFTRVLLYFRRLIS